MGLLLYFPTPWDAGQGDTSNYGAFKSAMSALLAKDAVVLYFDGQVGPPSLGNIPYAFYVMAMDFGSGSLLWTLISGSNASQKPASFGTDFPNAVQLAAPFSTPLIG